jgi:hypothetical protein
MGDMWPLAVTAVGSIMKRIFNSGCMASNLGHRFPPKRVRITFHAVAVCGGCPYTGFKTSRVRSHPRAMATGSDKHGALRCGADVTSCGVTTVQPSGCLRPWRHYSAQNAQCAASRFKRLEIRFPSGPTAAGAVIGITVAGKCSRRVSSLPTALSVFVGKENRRRNLSAMMLGTAATDLFPMSRASFRGTTAKSPSREGRQSRKNARVGRVEQS